MNERESCTWVRCVDVFIRSLMFRRQPVVLVRVVITRRADGVWLKLVKPAYTTHHDQLPIYIHLRNHQHHRWRCCHISRFLFVVEMFSFFGISFVFFLFSKAQLHLHNLCWANFSNLFLFKLKKGFPLLLLFNYLQLFSGKCKLTHTCNCLLFIIICICLFRTPNPNI